MVGNGFVAAGEVELGQLEGLDVHSEEVVAAELLFALVVVVELTGFAVPGA
jgi:hypothetical protein